MLHLQLVAYTPAPLGFKDGDGSVDSYAIEKSRKFSAKMVRVGVMNVTNDKVFITRSCDMFQFAKPFFVKA